jgi:hypothetical protein
MTFRDQAVSAALTWKRCSPLVPDNARNPAPYFDEHGPLGHPLDLCLPVEFAACNLLPDARKIALDLFRRDHIRWHAQTPAGPSNHLLDSQVQCANALAPIASKPDLIHHAFGTSLDIQEVVPFEPEKPDFLVFEWIGLNDYLDEGHGKARTRGELTTSVDAAFRYRTPSGSIEIALCEWKYTEKYGGKPLKGSLKTRIDRYRRWWDEPQGPVRTDVIPYEDLFVEPFYQLFRQQLLAHEMERAHELEAECVRVVYCAPAANTELWNSLTRPSHRAAGGNVRDAWKAMVVQPDRFVVPDTTAMLIDPNVTSPAFRQRYGLEQRNGGT